jgi:hypothetical protein
MVEPGRMPPDAAMAAGDADGGPPVASLDPLVTCPAPAAPARAGHTAAGARTGVKKLLHGVASWP